MEIITDLSADIKNKKYGRRKSLSFSCIPMAIFYKEDDSYIFNCINGSRRTYKSKLSERDMQDIIADIDSLTEFEYIKFNLEKFQYEVKDNDVLEIIKRNIQFYSPIYKDMIHNKFKMDLIQFLESIMIESDFDLSGRYHIFTQYFVNQFITMVYGCSSLKGKGDYETRTNKLPLIDTGSNYDWFLYAAPLTLQKLSKKYK